MQKNKKLLIFGDSAFAEVAYELFSHDSEYEVAAFVVDEAYRNREELFGLPVVAFEQAAELYPPDVYEMHVALVYNKLNRVRREKYLAAKAKGYRLANYISSRAFVWQNVTMGDNVFIFEDNTIQPFVRLGSNIVFWSGNHIGHHSTVGSHCFISSHVVVSGFVNVGESCFFGVNASFANNIDIGDDCLVGAGALVVRNLPAGSLVKGTPSPIDTQSTHEKFGISPL